MKQSDFQVKNRVWILSRQKTFLGDGRINLLKEIGKQGSISKAAREMNMSYLKAWKLVDSMNKTLGTPLVEKISGGKNGGGSVLTITGKKTIALYAELSSNSEIFLQKEANKFIYALHKEIEKSKK